LERITLFTTDLIRTIDQREEVVASGRRARKHRTGVNSLEVGLSYAFGNTLTLNTESGIESTQKWAWSVGVNLLYSLRNVGFRSGLHYTNGALMVPLDVMVKTEGRVCGFATVGGYWSHQLTTPNSPELLRNEWGLSWSLGGKLGDLSIEATYRYALTPEEAHTPHTLRRTTLCTLGWWF
jgi:hypothetical protein